MLFRSHFAPFFDAIETDRPVFDYKSLLQEYVQSRQMNMPAYEIQDESGPDHDKTFRVTVTVGGFTTEGVGKNKKGAEQDAAQRAYDQLKAQVG